jgi:Na+-translocating ferredoxin:NAD+ oxidoreductase RNF subunit RnfB
MMNTVYIVLGILGVLLIFGKLHRQQERKVIHVVESNCTGCQRCVKRCSHRALAMAEDGRHVMVNNPHTCTGCGDCLSKCKFFALELVKRTDKVI